MTTHDHHAEPHDHATPLEPVERLHLQVGAFVILGLLLAVGFIATLGGSRHVFEQRVTLHTHFADVQGLRAGASVWLAGVNVGRVTQVAFSPSAFERRVRVDFQISRKALERVRQDSLARIDSQGLLGDKLLTLSVGSAESAALSDGALVQSEAPPDLNQMLVEARGVLAKMKVATDSAADAIQAIARPETVDDFRKIAGSMRRLGHQVEQGPGLLHALFYDERTGKDVGKISQQLQDLITHVDYGVKRIDTILGNTSDEGRQVINNLSHAARRVSDVADELHPRELMATLERTARHADAAFGDVAAMTAKARRGEGTVGALVNDPTVYEQLVTILGGIQRSRVLRALVRFAISKDKGASIGKTVE